MGPTEINPIYSSADGGRHGSAETSSDQSCPRALLFGSGISLQLFSSALKQNRSHGGRWIGEATGGRWEQETGRSRARILGSDGW